MSAGIACIGFSWIASPACTELEMITMDWLGKLLGLPEEFLNASPGHGGGVLQVKKFFYFRVRAVIHCQYLIYFISRRLYNH